MTRRLRRIVATGPSTRDTAVAVLEGAELIYYGVEAFKHQRSPHDILTEARRKVLRLIADFQPASVVIEKTFHP